MTLIGNIWGVITFAALLYGCVMPFLERKDNQERFNKSK